MNGMGQVIRGLSLSNGKQIGYLFHLLKVGISPSREFIKYLTPRMIGDIYDKSKTWKHRGIK